MMPCDSLLYKPFGISITIFNRLGSQEYPYNFFVENGFNTYKASMVNEIVERFEF